MAPEQFCYWLQGFFELSPDIQPTEAQIKMIREHLQTVFHKITPAYSKPPWEKGIGQISVIPGQTLPLTVTC